MCFSEVVDKACQRRSTGAVRILLDCTVSVSRTSITIAPGATQTYTVSFLSITIVSVNTP
jgi:hypothetical protein